MHCSDNTLGSFRRVPKALCAQSRKLKNFCCIASSQEGKLGTRDKHASSWERNYDDYTCFMDSKRKSPLTRTTGFPGSTSVDTSKIYTIVTDNM